MAIIADKQYSLVDYAKQFDPSGQELAIAEVLSKSNDIIADALVVESSLDSGHEYAVRKVREEVAHYKATLERNHTPFKILEETEQPDGSIILKVIRQYNQTPVGDYLN